MIEHAAYQNRLETADLAVISAHFMKFSISKKTFSISIEKMVYWPPFTFQLALDMVFLVDKGELLDHVLSGKLMFFGN